MILTLYSTSYSWENRSVNEKGMKFCTSVAYDKLVSDPVRKIQNGRHFQDGRRKCKNSEIGLNTHLIGLKVIF